MSQKSADHLDEILDNRHIDPGSLAPLRDVADQIGLLREVPPQSPDKVAAGRQAFLAQAAQFRRHKEARAVSRAAKEDRARWPRWLSGLFAQGRKKKASPVLAKAFLGIMILLLLVGGLAVTATTADAALPGSALYPIDLALENARLALTADPQARAELTLALAEERLEEITTLSVAGRVPPETVLVRLETHLQQSLDSAAQLPDAKMAGVLQTLKHSVEAQKQATAQAMLNAPEQAQEALNLATDVLALAHRWAELGLTDPSAFREAKERSLRPTQVPAPTMPALPPTALPTPAPTLPALPPTEGSVPVPTPTLVPAPTQPAPPPTALPTSVPTPTLVPAPTRPAPPPTAPPTSVPTPTSVPPPSPTNLPSQTPLPTPTEAPSQTPRSTPTELPPQTPLPSPTGVSPPTPTPDPNHSATTTTNPTING